MIFDILIGFVVILILIIFVGLFIGVYNSLIRLKNNIEKAWSNIDVLLKQRSDELPKLIDTVKGYVKHEKSLLENLTKARTSIINANSVSEKASASNVLSGALKSLFAVTENYPDLKSNQNFLELQHRITHIENMIADRREFYNDSVNTYNIRIEQIPYVFIATFLKYRSKDLFKATNDEKMDVNMSF